MGLLRKIKSLTQKLSGKYSFFRKIKLNHVWYGNYYGGFYLHPDTINSNSVVYSFGIGEDISFDKAVIAKHGCKLYGFDPTPKSIEWIGSQDLPNNFQFQAIGIGVKSGYLDFYLPKNKEHVSGSLQVQNNVDLMNKVSVEVKTLKDIMAEYGHTHIDVLKMDIEGTEYDVVENILASNLSIQQIVIEFHDRLFEDGIQKTKKTVESLFQKGYKVFAISDTFEEVSFILEQSFKINSH